MKSARLKGSALLASGAVFFTCLSGAHAQTYIEEYKAYNAALESGDVERVIEHAYAAWQAAEEELGDDRLTAILAYNYGQQVLFSDTKSALPALKRAQDLREAGVAELPDEELALYLAYAEFANNNGARSEAKALRDLLQERIDEGATPNPDTVQMWVALAESDIRNERYRYTETSARNAEELIAAVFPDNYRAQAKMVILQGVARIASNMRRKHDFGEAVALFNRAIDLFPPQKSIDDFDLILAQAMAWEDAANAVYYSEILPGRELPMEGHRIFDPPLKPWEACGIIWKSRESPEYPEDALDDGYVGAVTLGYRLGDDDRVHDARILAEVPSDKFSEAVLEVVKEWRLAEPPPDDPLCRDNRYTMISFSIN